MFFHCCLHTFLLRSFIKTWFLDQKSLPQHHPIQQLIDDRWEAKQVLFINSLLLKRENTRFKFRKNIKTNTTGAHLWALCGAKTSFPPQRIVFKSLPGQLYAPMVHRIVSSLPSPPLRIIWQCPFDQRRAECIPNGSYK